MPLISLVPLMRRMLSYCPLSMAQSELSSPYVTRKFFTMLLWPAQNHTSPKATSLSVTDAAPEQPDEQLAVIAKVTLREESGVGCSRAFQRPAVTVAGTV